MKSSGYISRLDQILKFNSENMYRKRGIAILPTKYGVGFTEMFFNQGSALVLCYTDGSILGEWLVVDAIVE